ARKIAVFGLIRLPTLLHKLNEKHADAVFTYINSYEIDSDDHPNTGFTYTRESCCEVASGSVPCASLSVPCSNRSDHVYWDGEDDCPISS
ncbi:hypothetical protein D5086_031877, partial [Populus alba]